MQIDAQTLNNRLDEELDVAYTIVGEEHVVLDEIRESIVAKARQVGFREIDRLYSSERDWEEITTELSRGALFSQDDKRLIEIVVDMPTSQFPAQGLKCLETYLEKPVRDHLILIRPSRYEYRQRSTGWFKSLAASTTLVLAPRLWPNQQITWAAQYAKRHEIRIESSALQRLVAMCEGNMISAKQELDRLHLSFFYQANAITSSDLELVDSRVIQQYTVVDATFLGESRRVNSMMRKLAAENASALDVVYSLLSQLRTALLTTSGKATHASRGRQAAIRSLLQRHSRDQIKIFFQQAGVIHGIVIGVYRGDAWGSLHRLLMLIAGSNLRSEESIEAYRRIDYSLGT